ncbi:PstS family phosphate ABC transporter substrate-binding protein [Clostridium boliviensis]|uniref:Phosphate-binding protein n=1 Tax=Clostridium boliviensis TaxID=318465 RepID=A0ABU4GNN4_9CLOT|nr:PstS family phosphate ABC transporter substrate-binding protein [Clostridium boliviensis]MDW2799232.1 PstS family phosphate ABC transporter substrate-binding protein [Clostridium boliviensis]
MKKINSKKSILLALLLTSTFVFTGCGQQQSAQQESGTAGKLSGEIRIDGSSTVFPITEAVVEEFNKSEPDVKIPVGISGTGGGFKKFVTKETDISNASRPIKDEEAKKAKDAGVDYIELKVAYDGLSVLVNPENTWVDSLTVEELKKIWNPDSEVKTWKDVRDEWPEEEIKLYAPGTDSGTFDYFTEEINGESGAIRSDFTGSEDDNVLVQGIAGDKNALGFFGFAYYEENQDKLKLVPIDNGNGAVTPSFETIKSGEYAPLSRPIFIYVNKEALTRAEVKEFVKFYLEKAKDIVPEVGYVSLPEEEYKTESGQLE